MAQVQGVTDDLGTCLADAVPRWLLVACRVDEVAGLQAEDSAVGEKLVEVGVRVAGWFLGLVLGVDDGGRRAAEPPDDVGLEEDFAGYVEVVARLCLDVAAVGGPKRLLECDRYEVLEQLGHVEQEAVYRDHANAVFHGGRS